MSRLLAFLLYLALCIASLGALLIAGLNFFTLWRGFEPFASSSSQLLGTNTALEQYSTDADLNRALALVKGAGLRAVRQHFPWREIEATPGQFNWDKWDRIVQHTRAVDLQILAVLDTAPTWTQRDYEREFPNAPP